MSNRYVPRLLPRSAPARTQFDRRGGPPAVAHPLSSRDVKEVNRNLEVVAAAEDATAYIVGHAQYLGNVLYQHLGYCLNDIFATSFQGARSLDDPDAQEYGIQAAHAISAMSYEDLADLTRLGTARMKELVDIPLEPRKYRDKR